EVSERLIADAPYPYPQGLVIATKAGFERPGPDQWKTNGRPEHLRAACDGSLRLLKLECIDLYQLHRIDPKVPFADQLGTFRRLQEEGKIRHVGLSEVSVGEIERARKIVPIVSVQNRYSPTDRQHEGVLDHCEREKMAFLPWYPLGAGAALRASSRLARVAARLHATPAQVALAWLLRRSQVMLPIPGTSSVKHLEENVAARCGVTSPASPPVPLGFVTLRWPAKTAPTSRCLPSSWAAAMPNSFSPTRCSKESWVPSSGTSMPGCAASMSSENRSVANSW